MTNQVLVVEARDKLRQAKNNAELDQLKSVFLGKKSYLETQLAKLKDLPKLDRAKSGQELNQLKSELGKLFTEAYGIQKNKDDQKISELDLSLPGKEGGRGHLHPTSHILSEIYEIFTQLGYMIVDSGEIETDWYNFEALNIPPEHPARDMQDTFYLTTKYRGRPLVVRTHTSGMQVRYLETHKPPIKIIVPGKAYRNEDEDATHSWSFYQCEGLVVGEGVSLANLKGTLESFVKAILGEDSEIRLRPSFFPYTEPSVEIDVLYQGEWLELLGAGMVHPMVLENAGVDSTKYSGFAFGVGVERLAIVKYKYQDVRLNWRPNLYFLEQFSC